MTQGGAGLRSGVSLSLCSVSSPRFLSIACPLGSSGSYEELGDLLTGQRHENFANENGQDAQDAEKINAVSPPKSGLARFNC